MLESVMVVKCFYGFKHDFNLPDEAYKFATIPLQIQIAE